ncbi:tyrosine-type recombinase/integrase [Parablautia intestinalis]|uniref:tyrosine-type recombinase/integrase n=1 Tax=Parablautia intestinalis TaxID=2320100 RepID=UPI00256ECCB1|nr:site-specific integrase [Parablautia intestinalis]
MCMTKNELINDVAAGLVMTLSEDHLELVKATFLVKMQGYDIHEVNTLPSAEVKNNDFILKRFTVDMLARGVKESSIKSYLNIIRPFFDYTRLNFMEVTSQHIIDYLAVKKMAVNITGKKNSQSYIAGICRVLFVFFEWAYRKHHIEQDIMRDVDRVKERQKKKERITPEEMEACRECAQSDREKALLELMLSTGLRVGEITALKIEDIDFQTRRLHVREGKSDSSERDVYLSIRARNAIQKYIKKRYAGYVFRPTRNILDDGVQIGKGTIEKIAKDIGERAGAHCKTTVHIYRKTFASETYRRTKNVKMVSLLLGHANTAITEKYYLVDDLKDIEYQALYAVQ